MGRKRALNGIRVIPLVIAGLVGYWLGGWNVTALRSNTISAAQSVALRFPEDQDVSGSGPVQEPIQVSDAGPSAAADGSLLESHNNLTAGSVQLSLFSPQPMAAPSIASDAAGDSHAQSLQATASIDNGAMHDLVAETERAVSAQPVPPQTRSIKTAATIHDLKPAMPAVDHRSERPGFVLNDAQIASVKRRLNLTPDQERMWPAVEAALRNLTYTAAHDARRRNPSGGIQLASADPNSAQVQDLKSAAIPLIMSFNSDQRDEVRNLAHVMGLDQLASQF